MSGASVGPSRGNGPVGTLGDILSHERRHRPALRILLYTWELAGNGCAKTCDGVRNRIARPGRGRVRG